jgi:hypothetical protein
MDNFTLKSFKDYNVSTRDIYVDSNRRIEPYGNTYTMYIQDPIKLVTQVDLVTAIYPNTMFNITNPNIFTINEYALYDINVLILFLGNSPTFINSSGIPINLYGNLPTPVLYEGDYPLNFTGTKYIQSQTYGNEFSDSFTIEFSSMIQSSSGIMNFCGTYFQGYGFYLAFNNTDNSVLFFSLNENLTLKSKPNTFLYNVYNTVALCHNSTTNKLSLYVNGLLADSALITIPIDDGTNNFSIGNGGSSSPNIPFSGYMLQFKLTSNCLYNSTSYKPEPFTTNIVGGLINAPITINPGFYSACTLTNIINSNQPYVNFDILEAEGKLIVSNIYATTSGFTFTNVSQEFTNITKIQNNTSSVPGTSSLNYFSGSQIIVSNNVFDFHTTGNFVFLEIEELRPPYAIDAVSYSTDPNSNFSESFQKFATLPLDSNSGSLKIFKEMTDYKISVKYPTPIDKIDRLSVRWLDTNGNILSFNGAEQNSFILRFHMLEPPEVEIIHKVKKVFENKSLLFYFMFTFILIVFILFS